MNTNEQANVKEGSEDPKKFTYRPSKENDDLLFDLSLEVAKITRKKMAKNTMVEVAVRLLNDPQIKEVFLKAFIKAA